jgi:predicted RNA-binding protein YlxR (DUF448 family)
MTAAKKQPQRTCIGCGQIKDKRLLIRIVRSPDGDYAVDATGKRNGRGAYLCPSSDCLERAWKTKGLDRSFASTVPRCVYDKLREELTGLAG